MSQLITSTPEWEKSRTRQQSVDEQRETWSLHRRRTLFPKITLFTVFDPLWLSWIYLSVSQHTVIKQKRKVFLFPSSPIKTELTARVPNPFSVVFYSFSVFTMCEINVLRVLLNHRSEGTEVLYMADSEHRQNRASCWCLLRFNYSSLLLFVLCTTRTKKAIKFPKGQMKRAKPRQNFRYFVRQF